MRTAPWAVAGVLTLIGSLTQVTPALAAPETYSLVAPTVPLGDAGTGPGPGTDAGTGTGTADADRLEVYVGTVPVRRLDELRAIGVDHEDTELRPEADGQVEVQVVLTGRQAAKLAGRGITLTVKRVRGQDAGEALRQQGARTPAVFRRYGGAGGIRAELLDTAARYPGLAKVETIGRTVRGTPITAVKVTKNARTLPDGRRPAVLYVGAQHAREWITPEMIRRLMHHVLAGYRHDDAVTGLLERTELWFIPVANPDGYDHTFTDGNRLWRKNLRDNNGDGQITGVDGVDLNRNFGFRWGYDDEGSSPDPAAETYRGPAPSSEPETTALDRLFRRVGFEFFVNYHSAAELLLYGVGWQVGTPTPDDLIYRAMVGDDAHPAVPGYDPDLSAELYTTNGDTDTHATVRYGTLGFTPEMSTCATAAASVPDDEWLPENCVSDFAFPDDEALIDAEVTKNLPFALAVAGSAEDPDNPVSVVGRSTPDFVVDGFDVSYGGRQQVATIARRALRDVRMHYRIGDRPVRTTRVREWAGGERYGDSHDDYYAELRGTVTGARPGDQVRVWFTGRADARGRDGGRGRDGSRGRDGGRGRTVTSTAFSYRVHTDIGGDVLLLAAEDVTGISPAQEGTTGRYVQQHVSALTTAGYSVDVYDVDAMGRVAPHHLGVLSHYRAVVWETGDDVIPRSPGQAPGTISRAGQDTEYAVRDYLNEGGKLLVGGQHALYAQSTDGTYSYRPDAPPECVDPEDPACVPVLNDFQQYYLGAYSYVDDGGSAPDGVPHGLSGRGGALAGWSGVLNAAGSAGNQRHTAALLPTSSFLPRRQFPQFTSAVAADWERPGAAPFDPYTGLWYLYSGRSNESYKRVSRTVDLRGATSGRLTFRVSYDTEPDWDYLFVEAHRVGTDDWTTLPDGNGHTSASTGESCPQRWATEVHPFLAHYQGADCVPRGTTGAWHAASGPSGGWQEWSVDLSAYAGGEVELSISYASDWSNQGLGVFLDDVRVTVDDAPAADTSFETGVDGWTTTGAPSGSQPNTVDWTRTQAAFDDGGVVVTPDTVYTGFGLEGLAPEARADLVARVLRHLLVTQR